MLTDRQTNKKTDKQNYTNFERNLAMMVIYLPVKFEFDWTNRFRVRVRKQKCGRTDRRTDVGHINLIGGLVTHNPPKNSIRDARTPKPREIFLTPRDIEVLYQYKVQDTSRALSII